MRLMVMSGRGGAFIARHAIQQSTAPVEIATRRATQFEAVSADSQSAPGPEAAFPTTFGQVDSMVYRLTGVSLGRNAALLWRVCRHVRST